DLCEAVAPMVGTAFDLGRDNDALDRGGSLIFLYETAFVGAIEQRLGDLIRELLEVDQVEHMGKHVARMAAPHRLVYGPVVLFQKTQGESLRARQLAQGAKTLEDAHEFAFAGTLQQHLILNAPQEGFVAQIRRVQVRGEHEESLERRRHLAAGEETQIIDTALHGHDPTVEDLGGGGKLAAEVVDEIHAVIGLELQRGFVNL